MITITAISTPSGRGGIGIIRLSGDKAIEIADKCFSSSVSVKEQEPRKMYLGSFVGRDFSDKALCVKFVAPESYTGEDLVEFHVHGGVYLTTRVLHTLIENGARQAGAGEFTERAVLNGKMSLDEAEGVIDVIEADSALSLRAGFRQMTGRLHGEIVAIQQEILDMLVDISAAIDYPDEVEEEVYATIAERIDSAYNKVKKLRDSNLKGRLIKNGIRVAILGKPNVGKSSLLNAILGTDRAIVTDIAGTTRDVIEEGVHHNGVMIRFMDTAGIRESSDVVEKVGIKKALEVGDTADVIVLLLDGEKGDYDYQEIKERYEGKQVFVCVNKCDVVKAPKGSRGLSAKTGEGVEQLLDDIASIVGVEDGEIVTSSRHTEALTRATDSLSQAKQGVDNYTIDCISVDLKDACTALSLITGEGVDASVIDGVFDKFCVGK